MLTYALAEGKEDGRRCARINGSIYHMIVRQPDIIHGHIAHDDNDSLFEHNSQRQNGHKP